jgi:hypothetical protein
MAYDIINQYLASIDAAQRQEQARVTSGAGRHAIRDVSALEKWMRNIGSEQLTEAGRRQKRGAKAQKAGIGGAGLGYMAIWLAKQALKLFPATAPLAAAGDVADVLWKVGGAIGAYGGYKQQYGQVPYNYRKPTAQAPQTTFAQPKYEDILGDIERINIQGETMEALHSAAGEEMAQKVGMMLMPWTDIVGLGMPSLPGGDPGAHGAKWGTWQGTQSASRDPLQGLYNLFGKR